MDKPTKEQVRRFWEWCGLKPELETDHYSSGYKNWILWSKDGNRVDTPQLDLDNLFKYAVPKLHEFGFYYEILQWNNSQHKAIINKKTHEWAETYSSSVNKDPALALFWAIYSVITKGGR